MLSLLGFQFLYIFFQLQFLPVFALALAVKLFEQKHYQSKGFLFFGIGSVFWFIAEFIWLMYDHVWDGSPFPSEADIFYIGAYPFMTGFLFISLKPVLKSVSKKCLVICNWFSYFIFDSICNSSI